jgi:hypothetical protein
VRHADGARELAKGEVQVAALLEEAEGGGDQLVLEIAVVVGARRGRGRSPGTALRLGHGATLTRTM